MFRFRCGRLMYVPVQDVCPGVKGAPSTQPRMCSILSPRLYHSVLLFDANMLNFAEVALRNSMALGKYLVFVSCELHLEP